MTARGSLRAARAVLVQLALAAMVLRALIPAGWMPNPAAAATGIPLAICTGHGPATIYLDADGKPVPHHDHGQTQSHDICPFAAAAHMAPPVLAAGAPAPALIAVVLRRQPTHRAAGQVRSSAGHSPRAPPHLV